MGPVYRVSFFKKLIGGNGYEVDAVQGVVEVHASSEDGAIEMARPLFARRAGVRAWSLRADSAAAEVLPRRKYASGSGPERW
jgi:1,2-phenylacetyl-CoA epoxidase PaaB subunit